MIDYVLTLDGITKSFGRRLVFSDINCSFSSGNIYGISGPNGSGKSTLVRIIANLISPTRGNVIHKLDNKIIEPEKLHNHIGFVSPYLFLYDEFTAEENLVHVSKIRGIKFDKQRSDSLFEQFGLFDRKNDVLRGYSSGMKQRFKFIFALLHEPQLLILDEPTSNLDNDGKDIVYKLIENKGKNNLILIASNENSDLQFCKQILDLEEFKKSSLRS